jgi:hypothetical protein
MSSNSNARRRARYHSDPEYRARVLAQCADYRERNPDKAAVPKSNYYKRNTEAVKERVAEWRDANPETCKAYSRKAQRTRSGMLNATGETRSGACPICLKTRRKLCCDHDHTTGKIRGWLCSMCNIFLGPSDDGRVDRAKAYLEKAKQDAVPDIPGP